MHQVAFKLNGVEVSVEEFRTGKIKPRRQRRQASKGPMIATSYSRPLKSLGMAVNPKQVRQFNEAYVAAGITGARHAADGTCEIDSRQARNQVLRLRGLRDNDAGYGDYAGK